jgi:hypothetical protein
VHALDQEDDPLSSDDDYGDDNGGGDDDDRCPDPDDEDIATLIRSLLEKAGRPVTEDEIDRIVERVAEAEFDRRDMRVRRHLRGVSYQGRTVGDRDEALFVHLAQRVIVDGQWRDGTNAEEYVEDLRAAVRDPEARIGVGQPEGSQPLVYVLANNPVPDDRRGAWPEALMFVLYGADSGVIITGYQASGMEAIDFPENVRWLR